MMYKKKLCAQDECTLCMACVNSCPRDAIYIKTDNRGFECLEIDDELCINCGVCTMVCNKRYEVKKNIPICSYAAQLKDKKNLKLSASGGVYQALARHVLQKKGVCYGSYGRFENGEFKVEHIRVDNEIDLPSILNSKYVVSRIGKIYKEIKTDLSARRLVLFCGTPCQAQGLRGFLGKEYDNLIIADIICHGVTSAQLFNDYIDAIEQLDGCKVTSYIFRDKSICWGTNYQYQYVAADGKKITRHCPREESSYMAHYLRGNLFRDNCYKCTLANIQRVSDITLGDFWGIEKTHPEISKGQDKMSIRAGIGCVMANTDKGIAILRELGDMLDEKEVDLESIVANNGNLRSSSYKNQGRDDFLEMYKNNGYLPIEKEYRLAVGRKRYLFRVKNMIKSYMPDAVRIKLYKIFVK